MVWIACSCDWPFFHAVSAMECMEKKASAPLSDLKVPDTFCFIFSFRIPLSARLSQLLDNARERLNRYISLSRRNSLFFGSHTGARRAAMFYSLACSCRLQGVNFFKYISDIINKAAAMPPRTPLSKYRDLLPDRWKQKNIAQE